MKSDKKIGIIAGSLFLLVFVTGIIVYQVLQGPVLFSDDFLTAISESSNAIVVSVLLLFLSGLISVVIATILLPIFRRYSVVLAFLYVAFSILGFVAISLDNFSVLSMLELSLEHSRNGTDPNELLHKLGPVFYRKHWWTHYLSLLISCFPVFILYYSFFMSRLIPRALSVVGIIAVILMFIEILFSILGAGISMNMLLPMGLIQLILPLWLIFKGFNSSALKTKIN